MRTIYPDETAKALMKLQRQRSTIGEHEFKKQLCEILGIRMELLNKALMLTLEQRKKVVAGELDLDEAYYDGLFRTDGG